MTRFLAGFSTGLDGLQTVAANPQRSTFAQFHWNDLTSWESLPAVGVKTRGKPMIAKDYFKRQATTLRNMVRVTRNRTIAHHLILMAEDFDNRSEHGTDELAASVGPPPGTVDREENHD
jgi:hypothetical protein